MADAQQVAQKTNVSAVKPGDMVTALGTVTTIHFQAVVLEVTPPVPAEVAARFGTDTPMIKVLDTSFLRVPIDGKSPEYPAGYTPERLASGWTPANTGKPEVAGIILREQGYVQQTDGSFARRPSAAVKDAPVGALNAG